jgi:hypothetical protein
MRLHPAMIALVGLGLSGAGCDENLTTLAGPTPNLAPTFASIQREIFERTDSAGRLACVTCHNDQGQAQAGGLNLLHDVAYDQIVNVSSVEQPGLLRVRPGNPDASYLVHKVEGRVGISGRRMPFTPPYLSDGQILILRRWIESGAPRN